MRGDLILNTYNDFIEQFKRNFGDPFAKENARLKWKALKQQENQSVGDYNRYFTEVTTLAEYDQMNNLTLGRYKESIKNEIYKTIMGWEQKGNTLWWMASSEKVELEKEDAERGRRNPAGPQQERVRGVQAKTPAPEEEGVVAAVQSGPCPSNADALKKAKEAYKKDPKSFLKWKELWEAHMMGNVGHAEIVIDGQTASCPRMSCVRPAEEKVTSQVRAETHTRSK
ncbi:hypothetical protein BDN72DRAFT_906645 [Pluteus cervinus]|uniref:Uncharacterized protein n=1 Tax=Pluteus cervinus TaxID=181527 RepID=A0ACD2ZYA1_9AGAR|nr:hypothetical protein BDN72DRAFT_906645 [Pluteus cervinus]